MDKPFSAKGHSDQFNLKSEMFYHKIRLKISMEIALCALHNQDK